MPTRVQLAKLTISCDSSALNTISQTPSPHSTPKSGTQLRIPGLGLAFRPAPKRRLPPPRSPYPWIWRCCSCHTPYRLGCIRRCLVCSHEYCTSVTPTRKKRRYDGNGKLITCGAEFDYEGWANRGAWRRLVLRDETACSPGRQSGTEIPKREWKFLSLDSACWLHCDFPSECHHRRFEIGEKIRAGLVGLAASDENKSPVKKRRRRNTALHPDDELPLNEPLAIVEEDRERPQSPASQESFFFDEPAEVEKRRNGNYKQCRAGSPAVDGVDVSEDELARLLEEDLALMPLEEAGVNPRMLVIRNLAGAD